MKNRSLVLLSGEGTTIPAAEAKALFLTYDPSSSFQSPERRVLIAESKADPATVARRIAFARRVGVLIDDPSEVSQTVRGRRVRIRTFSLEKQKPGPEPYGLLDGLDVRVDLENPEFEFTVVQGARRYIALTAPRLMRQGWSHRRPRRRAYFHPSAIFPKLSRALVNLTRCREGKLLLDPFSGTGSIPIEAWDIGLNVVAFDQAAVMARGSLANMRLFEQSWAGVVRADAFRPPITRVDGIATDVPYGRAASTRGRKARDVIQLTMGLAVSVLGAGSLMVLMHPKLMPVEPLSGLTVEDEHYLYVHKRLTRAITILRRS
ncbi:MAG: hypothetical protein LYZ69_01925 [Nitrososphaerales archaeon]|nr:hypothetical protein [Nitrososphaerales archaeon]